MVTNDPRYTRSSDYREKFIKENPGIYGLYICTYCGRIVKSERMEVDHVIPVNLAQRKKLYRWLLKSKNINSKDNLTASCRRCNRKKSNYGGIWILLGKVGSLLQPVLWLMFIPAIVWYILWFWTSKPYLFFI